MITFKAIVIPGNRRMDGTYPVKIRVTYKGVARRMPTTLVCTQNDLTRTLKIKNGSVITRTDEIIGQMREAVKDISPFELENWDVDDVVIHIKKRLTGESFRLDFFEWCEKYMQTKTGTTRAAYSNALNTFERFLGCRELDINSITRTMLLDFVEFVDNEPKMHLNQKTKKIEPCSVSKIPKGASSRHLMKLQHMFNAAKARYNDEDEKRIVIPKSPFDKITKIFPASQGQKNLGAELMQRIINGQASDELTRIALDAFVASFGLMGANLADLYFATPFEGTWIYNRTKTRSRRADKAEMRVDIPEELHPYIERLQQHKGKWWLPTLHHLSEDKDRCTARINAGLKRWCDANGIPVFTFYAARHTWASLARKAGVDKAVIDECLVHIGDFRMTDIYAERDWEQIQGANRKVIAMLKWQS